MKRISKSGRVYNYCYQKTGKPHTGKPKGSGLKGKVTYNRNTKACLERDSYTCQICGSREDLHVHHKDNNGHHILKYEADDNLDNLQTLCRKCHIRLHFRVLERHKEIVDRRKIGETFESIGKSLGVSRQRIQQIYTANT